MHHRITILLSVVVAALFLPFFAGSANADEPVPGESCTTVFFDVTFGQGVEEFCADEPDNGYQVIAECTDGDAIWTVTGTFAEAGGGPSVATCRGGLLFPAHVLTYYLAP